MQIRIFNLSRHWPVIILLLALAAVAPINARGSQQHSASVLIEQLGASSFDRRQQAERLLQQQGSEALDALRNAADDADLEVRFRVRRLIGQIESDLQQRLLQNFLTDYDPELAQQLSGWPRYQELVGDDHEARQLFVEMHETEPEIMSAIDRRSLPLPMILEKRVVEMKPLANRHPTSMSVPVPATAALLLASLEARAQASANVRTLISSAVNESAFQRVAMKSANPPISRLLSAWVSAATEVPASVRRSIGARFNLPAAVDPAIELIRSRAHGSQLQYAAYTLAELGSAEHIPILERLLTNRTVLGERQRGDEETFTCQIRDVALVSLIHLVGKNPRDFGFTELRPNSNSLYALNTAGFDSAEDRDVAFRRWRLWCHIQRLQCRDIAENAVAGTRL